jgi:hypothetical protein
VSVAKENHEYITKHGVGITFQTRIQEVPSLNLDWESDYLEVIRVFIQSIH